MGHFHEQDQAHEHEHEHIHASLSGGTPGTKAPEGQGSVVQRDEATALLAYMVQHNGRHADELNELLETLPVKAREKARIALAIFDSANIELNEALEELRNGDSAREEQLAERNAMPSGESHTHSHVHDPKQKRRQIGRLSRVIGHLEYVRRMMEADEDCSAVLMQIAASKSALNGLGKEIISEHLAHCITHAVEDGDTAAIDDFQQAIKKYF